jgi:hypothetical protein
MAAAAVELASPEAMPLLAELNASPTKFLTSAGRPPRACGASWWAWP